MGVSIFPGCMLRPFFDKILQADVVHPAAHSEGRPSFASLVANIDSDTALYVADCRVQASRQEMIADLEEMSTVMQFTVSMHPLLLTSDFADHDQEVSSLSS